MVSYYDALTGVVLKDARGRYMLEVMTDNAYPAGREMEALQDECWDAAVRKHPREYANSTVQEISSSIRKMMCHAANQIRGKAHTIAKDVVVQGYELVPTKFRGATETVIADMVKTQLENDDFIRGWYTTVSTVPIHPHKQRLRSHQTRNEEFDNLMFCHPCIREVILRLFFKPKPSGSTLRRLNPIPGPLIALKCALDEWATGEFDKIDFTEKAYRNDYIHYRALWQLLEDQHKNRARIIATDITRYCMKMSGVKTTKDGGILEETNEEYDNIKEFGPPFELGGDDDDDDLPPGYD
jgi:hypothetical protein